MGMEMGGHGVRPYENISLAEVVQPMDGNGNVGANPVFAH